ncbi:hypothetical protein, partial [Paracoccus haematequi]|uniref:hypothetical protein n=1 Tax=Paracoccus haematequi TaxID=2491866 RepID=UPI0019D2E807
SPCAAARLMKVSAPSLLSPQPSSDSGERQHTLASGQDVPSSTGPVVSWSLRIFSKERPFLSLALPALSLGITLVVVLVAGVDTSKELIQKVLRVLGVITP